MSLDPDNFLTNLRALLRAGVRAFFTCNFKLTRKIAVRPVFGPKYSHRHDKTASWVHFCRKFSLHGNYVMDICQHG